MRSNRKNSNKANEILGRFGKLSAATIYRRDLFLEWCADPSEFELSLVRGLWQHGHIYHYMPSLGEIPLLSRKA